MVAARAELADATKRRRAGLSGPAADLVDRPAQRFSPPRCALRSCGWAISTGRFVATRIAAISVPAMSPPRRSRAGVGAVRQLVIRFRSEPTCRHKEDSLRDDRPFCERTYLHANPAQPQQPRRPAVTDRGRGRQRYDRGTVACTHADDLGGRQSDPRRAHSAGRRRPA